jgi:hypothetical protein
MEKEIVFDMKYPCEMEIKTLMAHGIFGVWHLRVQILTWAAIEKVLKAILDLRLMITPLIYLFFSSS